MNAARGAIVVIVALVIGVVILARGLDEPETTSDPVQTTGTTEATPTTVAQPPPPPKPTPPPPEQPPPSAAAAAPAPDDIPPDLEAVGDLVAPPPPAAAPTHNRSEVRLLVANGTALCGAAGRLATSLSAQGFNVLPATNADNPADASAVYYVEGYGADAGVVASLLQVDSSQVLAMPSSPPTAPGDAHVLLHIGADDLAQPNC